MRTRAGGNRSLARHALRAAAGAMVLLVCTVASPAAADRVRVLAVEPGWSPSGLVCAVRTSGLPDGPSRETIESGLPSALTLSFEVLDARGREQSRSNVNVRIEPDLWEGMIMLRSPVAVRRAAGMAELSALIERLGPFPIAHTLALDRTQRLRVRARLTVHPLAPAEAGQVPDLFGGETGRGDANRREVSAGLGSLLRFFLGRRPERRWAAEAESAPFTLEGLSSARAQDSR